MVRSSTTPNNIDKFFESVVKEYQHVFKNDKTNSGKTKSGRNLLRDKMEYWNKPENDSFNRVSLKISNVKTKMLDNVDKILQNTEKLDSISERTSELVDNSDQFKSKATTLKTKMRLEGYKMWLVLAVFVLIVIFLGVWIGCGVPDFYRCRVSSDSGATTVAPAPTPPI
jgi:hypothetical protein